MDRWAKLIGLLLGAIIGGYWLYEANLDGSEALNAGKTAMTQGRHSDAIVQFTQVLEEIQRSGQSPFTSSGINVKHLANRQAALRGLAEAHLKSGAPQAASTYLEHARQANAFDPMLPLLGAEIAEAQGDLQKAEVELSKVIESTPHFYRGYQLRARIRKLRNDCQGQAADYHSALQNLDAAHLLYERIDATLDLAWLLATSSDSECRNGAQAVKLLSGLDQMIEERYTPVAYARFLSIKAAALAAVGEYTAAKASAEQAALLVPVGSKQFSAIQLQQNAYNIGQPWREP